MAAARDVVPETTKCPVCHGATIPHCPDSPTCRWRKCRNQQTCGVTVGRRAFRKSGTYVPLDP